MTLNVGSKFDSINEALAFVRGVGIDQAQLSLDEDLRRRELGQHAKFLFTRYEDREWVLRAIGEILREEREERQEIEAQAFQEAIKQRIANEQAAAAATESVGLAGRSLDLARQDLETARASLDIAKSAYEAASDSNKIAEAALGAAARSATAAEDGVKIAKDALSAAQLSASAADKSARIAKTQTFIAVFAAATALLSAAASFFSEKPPIIVHAPAQQAQSHSGATTSGWRTIETTHQLAPTIDQ
ncbi:hypothetical protein [Achromobacter xylosoxidans]|uniref:hypothetical protein n=1 Tax=Alcaligenes xylosoxydans xylosoxydans TaxID=85698 RepID=UPI00128BFE78|nr:hypothetical protein [Achromobacter xylosoxidans]